MDRKNYEIYELTLRTLCNHEFAAELEHRNHVTQVTLQRSMLESIRNNKVLSQHPNYVNCMWEETNAWGLDWHSMITL